MALEAINKIQEAEIKASELLDEANSESKDIISNAQLKAEKEYETIIDNAKARAKAMKEEASVQGSNDAKPILEEGDAGINGILNTQKDKIDSAVNLVIGRIVKFNGNS